MDVGKCSCSDITNLPWYNIKDYWVEVRTSYTIRNFTVDKLIFVLSRYLFVSIARWLVEPYLSYSIKLICGCRVDWIIKQGLFEIFSLEQTICTKRSLIFVKGCLNILIVKFEKWFVVLGGNGGHNVNRH